MVKRNKSLLEILREYNREVEERLKRPRTPLDKLRLINLRNRLRAGRRELLELVRR